MDKCLDIYSLPNLNQDNLNKLNWSITRLSSNKLSPKYTRPRPSQD